jgi:sugar lactone lactonase YvrE
VIAGTAGVGFSGDGGSAVAAQLNLPTGVALDAQGNLFIADLGNNRVRKVNSAGVISTLAGTGAFGSDGDGGPATSARVNPFGVAVDGAGNLFIAEIDSNRVRRINPAGIISTVAGTGTRGFAGDNGPAVSAQFFGPKNVTVDSSGDLYIVDTFNNRIRKITPDGIITTVAGTGVQGFSGDNGPATSAQLNWPSGIALTAAGNLLIVDSVRIRSVSPAGVISTIAGGGEAIIDSRDGKAALSVHLGPVTGIAADLAGNIFVGESDLGYIRKMTPAGSIVTVAGNGRSLTFGGDLGPASAARLSQPWGISLDAIGNLFIADTGNNRIRMVRPDGISTTVAGNNTTVFVGEDGAVYAQELSRPRAVVRDATGNLFIADTGNHRIRKMSSGPFGGVLTTVAGIGTSGFSGDGGAAVAAQLSSPSGIAVDAAGNLFIADARNNRIRKVAPDGLITTVAGTTEGSTADGGPATAALLSAPSAVALDRAGNVFITDSGSNRIRKVTPSGIISTIAGTGTAGFNGDGAIATAAQLSLVGSSETQSTGLVVDGNGDVYFADTGNQRIRRVSRDGVITTVAGSGGRSFGGDGGPPGLAQFFNPSGIALDTFGNVYISDTFNNRVRKLTSTSETTFAIPDRGGASLLSSGTSADVVTGYATIQPNIESKTPAGLAIFGFRQNNVLISEASVLASPLLQAARIYAEVNRSVNTGIAIVNPNDQTATISFFFTGANGNFGNGTTSIPARGQISKFLSEQPFNMPSPTAGTFTFSSSAPVSVVALRGFTNERDDFLISTLPVVDLGIAPSSDPVILSHFAAGAGWTTKIVLVNATDAALNGAVQFLNPAGQPAAISTHSTYAIPVRSSQAVEIGGTSSDLVTGSILITPANNLPAPSVFAVFSVDQPAAIPGAVTHVRVTETAVPAVRAGSAFRLYAEVSPSIETGVAIANASASIRTVALELTRLDGSSTGLTGTLTVPPRCITRAFPGSVAHQQHLTDLG